MPWLMEQVTEHLKKSELGRMVLDGILREVVSKRMDLYAKIGQKPATPEDQSEQKDQQKDEPVQDTPSNAMPPSASATSEVNMTNQNEAILSRFKDLPCKVAKAFFIIIPLGVGPIIKSWNIL
jgi:hypothetical protein